MKEDEPWLLTLLKAAGVVLVVWFLVAVVFSF
jgi:hypothetical protein